MVKQENRGLTYLGHSANNYGLPQPYRDHVLNVQALSEAYAQAAARYGVEDGQLLIDKVKIAAGLHDLGKLYKNNQEVLRGKEASRRLPIDHVDPGVSVCKSAGESHMAEAVVIYAHHRGLPNILDEALREEENSLRNEAIRADVDKTLDNLLDKHRELVGSAEMENHQDIKGDASVFLRLLLSCLVDADHTDTARHFGNHPKVERTISLRPEERLKRLHAYMAQFPSDTQRNKLRREMYHHCASQSKQGPLTACDSPVGTGKTTALMAYLLKQAAQKKLRRIFVVLPFTNIIAQSVEVYRKALVLPGEDPESVVAELHHLSDFDDLQMRHLTSLWKSPIIVTTSVAFFETLAANKTSSLRRLHQLPGSAIFLDEAHASLPIHLLPIAWHWMNVLAKEWRCHWLFASGTLARFWEIPEIAKDKNVPVENVLDDSLAEKLKDMEQQRVSIKWQREPIDYKDFLMGLSRDKGPRIVVVNTIHTAAFLANEARKIYGREKVEHLSTALSHPNTKKTIKRIESRLRDPHDNDWTLFATTCVEAGMDFSFRHGYREMCSLTSLLQFIGRINRENKYDDATVQCFRFKDHQHISKNMGMKIGIEVLSKLFDSENNIHAGLSTKALALELKKNGDRQQGADYFLTLEQHQQFQTLAEEFKVIDADNVLVLVEDIDLEKADWMTLQKATVQIRKTKVDKWKLPLIKEGLYQWNREYDDFLGYMAGVLRDEE